MSKRINTLPQKKRKKQLTLCKKKDTWIIRLTDPKPNPLPAMRNLFVADSLPIPRPPWTLAKAAPQVIGTAPPLLRPAPPLNCATAGISIPRRHGNLHPAPPLLRPRVIPPTKPSELCAHTSWGPCIQEKAPIDVSSCYSQLRAAIFDQAPIDVISTAGCENFQIVFHILPYTIKLHSKSAVPEL
jgi:hypothetical protein